METKQPLTCPNADGILRPVSAHSRIGATITLDQCDHCGGVWFDKFELFQLDEAEASTIDADAKIDKASLRYPGGASENPLCPRCHKPLQAFTDSNIPNNIQMLICGDCEGFWVNHGALAGYARFREAGHRRPDPRLAEQYEKLLQGQSDKDYWQGIERFGTTMGAPRDALTGLSLSSSPAELERIDRTQDVFFAVLGTAARLLFGWL